MRPLSKKQKDIFDFITKCVVSRGYPPSVREIGTAVNLKSPSTVHVHLATLEKHGLISRDARKTRAIMLNAGAALGVPVIGNVAAGRPILAIEDAVGYIPYDPGKNGDFFALKIHGDSMINAGILDGDMVIVRKQPVADNGEIIVALIENEATCKKFSSKNGEVWLMPENDAYEPIDGSNAEIVGKVTAVIRTY